MTEKKQTFENTLNKKINCIFPYILGKGLDQPFINLECLNHQKRITIVWSGEPIIECTDKKCINNTIDLFWEKYEKQTKRLEKSFNKAQQIKIKINKILEKIDPDYDGYIAIDLIDFLLKLKILESKQETKFQRHPLLRVLPNAETNLKVAIGYMFNNLDAKIMQCCANCRFAENKKFDMEQEQKNKIIYSIINIILDKKQGRGEWHNFSRKLELDLRKYNILIDSNRFQNIIMEKHRVHALTRFNYISLSIATIISFSALIIAILQFIK